MKFSYLGRIGLKVSRLCLGTMNFGPRTDEKEAFEIMDRALEAGINFFDTANIYGYLYGQSEEMHTGWSEEIIGRWFAQGGNRREKVVLATKLYCDMYDGNDGPNGEGLSAYKIRKDIEGSLKRLQTDHIDLYQMHHIERHAPWEEMWGAFESIINQGKAIYIGSCNFGARHLAYAQAKAEKRNFLGLVSEQHRYSLVCRLPELEVIPAVEELGLGFMPWSPLGGGLLSGNILKPSSGISRSSEVAHQLMADQRRQLEAYSLLCKDIGESESNVALAWLLSNPAVTSPIIGPRTLGQLENALQAVNIKLPKDVLKKLDEIFPGPGGASPEAYAW